MKKSITENENDIIIYLSKNKDSIDNQNNIKDLKKGLNINSDSNSYEFYEFSSVDEVFNTISNSAFTIIYVVINEDSLEQFFEKYEKEIKDLMVVFANIIICKNIFKHYNKKYVKDLAYNPGGITDDIRNVITYIKNTQNYFYSEGKGNENYKNNKNDYVNLKDKNAKYEQVFIKIKTKEELILPTIMNKLINNILINDEELYNFQKILLYNYPQFFKFIFPSKEKYIKVPYEIMAKYFVYFYTLDSDFYRDLNKLLTIEEKKKIYTQLINIFYYSIYNNGFNNCSDWRLYRGGIMSKSEFEQIHNLLENQKNNNKKEGQLVLICSKNFLSFSRDKDTAISFINTSIENTDFVPYLFELEEIENTDYFIPNINVEENYSEYDEDEVLFLPYSCFLVNKITPAVEKEENYYIFNLEYLDKLENQVNKELKEMVSNPEGQKKLEKIFNNPFGKEIYGFFDNIHHQFEDFIKEQFGIEIKCEKPDLKTVSEDNNDIVFINYEPENHIKKHIPKNKKVGIIYNVNEEDIDEDGYVNILGKNFVEVNNNKVSLVINGKEENLCHKYKLNKGINSIEFIFKEKIQNYSYLFYDCTSLSDIDMLKDWDVSSATNLDCLFYGCSSLKDIYGLKKWNVKNVNHFSYLFYGCTSLKNISALKNWDVSEGLFFSCLFFGCTSLKNISALKNWNVSKGNYFNYLFYGCTSLKDISALKNWDVSNGNYFSYLFYGCTSLTNISPLKNWNVSNGNNFSYLFCNCDSLTDISPLKSWDVRNGTNFISMFQNCPIINESKPSWIYKTN